MYLEVLSTQGVPPFVANTTEYILFTLGNVPYCVSYVTVLLVSPLNSVALFLLYVTVYLLAVHCAYRVIFPPFVAV